MKNRFLLLTLACFLIFTASCANGTSNPSQNSAITTSPSIHSNPTEPTASSTTSQEFIGTIPPPLEVEEKGDLSALFSSDSACVVIYQYFSLADFETYLSTDSKVLEDYSIPPRPDIINHQPSKYFRPYYISLDELFGTNAANRMNPVELISAKLLGDGQGGVCISQSLGDVHVSVTYSTALLGNSTTEYYRAYHDAYNNPETFSAFSDLNAIKQHKTGYVTRNAGGYEVIYEFDDHLLKKISLVVDSYLVEIKRLGVAEDDTVEKFQTFMTQASTAPVAPLFSEDDKAFESALSKIVIAIRAKTQSLSESTLD